MAKLKWNVKSPNHPSSTSIRWLKFNMVGAIGIAVQLGLLALLAFLGLNYLLATAVAVESAVLHNFLWHERFTWADRLMNSTSHHQPATVLRLLRFNLTTGAVSIGGNLFFMRLLVAQAHLPVVVANLLSVAACSLLNFLVSDRWVFGVAEATFEGECGESRGRERSLWPNQQFAQRLKPFFWLPLRRD